MLDAKDRPVISDFWRITILGRHLNGDFRGDRQIRPIRADQANVRGAESCLSTQWTHPVGNISDALIH